MSFLGQTKIMEEHKSRWGARFIMNTTEQLDALCFDCKRFFESIIQKCSSKTEPKPAERCVCSTCLDVLSKSHSAETQRFRRHEHALVHKWLNSVGSEDEPAVPLTREIELEGFTQEYLERLDADWWRMQKSNLIDEY
jgi:hypothetical protein